MEAEALRAVQSAFRRHGAKLTQQRLVILEEAARRRDHPSAEDIFRHVRHTLPTVSLDTVYRTLRLLYEIGLVEALHADAQRLRFDADMRRHHHFVCSRCGAIHDVFTPALDPLALAPELSPFGRVERAQVEFRGVCAACLAAAGEKSVIS